MASVARSPHLDGLRGIAILLVVYSHAGLRFPTDGPFGALYLVSVKVGWCGGDLFFVLSGFLITRILLRTRESTRFFRVFYARRTLRIFPAYYLWLAFLLLLVPALPYFARFNFFRAGADTFSSLWYWTYTSNVGFVIDGGFPHRLLSLTWSLAIEEQFYLVWPLAVRLLGGPRLLWLCLACIALAPIARGGWLLAGGAPLGAYMLTPCRIDTLAIGAAIAVLAQGEVGVERLRSWAPRILGISGALVVALVGWRSVGASPADPVDSLIFDPWMQTAGYSLIALFFGSVVALAALPGARGVGWLRLRVLRTFGKYSYAMYLTHTFVGSMVVLYVFNPFDHGGTLPVLASYGIELMAMLAFAMASWWGVERHFDRAKRRFAYANS
jgi:peptidoglycan/LPS O-acetylase OafA/YrhL